jgi:hypothetical protein
VLIVAVEFKVCAWERIWSTRQTNSMQLIVRSDGVLVRCSTVVCYAVAYLFACWCVLCWLLFVGFITVAHYSLDANSLMLNILGPSSSWRQTLRVGFSSLYIHSTFNIWFYSHAASRLNFWEIAFQVRSFPDQHKVTRSRLVQWRKPSVGDPVL